MYSPGALSPWFIEERAASVTAPLRVMERNVVGRVLSRVMETCHHQEEEVISPQGRFAPFRHFTTHLPVEPNPLGPRRVSGIFSTVIGLTVANFTTTSWAIR
jgi:hypothetical protein